MIQITVNVDRELIANLEGIIPSVRNAVALKFNSIISQIYEKAVVKFPQKVNPREHIIYGVEETGDELIGFIETEDKVTGAIEFGGAGYYPIVPIKARLLVFLGARDGKKIAVDFVLHPPMRAKNYILQTIQDSIASVESQLEAFDYDEAVRRYGPYAASRYFAKMGASQ